MLRNSVNKLGRLAAVHATRTSMFAMALTLAYVVLYLGFPATPGNSPGQHPLGWWGWFDQSQYLKSALAFRAGNLDPSEHFYPPVYPLIGAAFLFISSGHFYFVINLVCLLWFAYVFVWIAEEYISKWMAILIFILTSVTNFTIFQNYLIPWTSTFSTGLLATGLLGLMATRPTTAMQQARITTPVIVMAAFALGMVVPTRPADAPVALVIAAGIGWNTIQLLIRSQACLNEWISACVLVIAAGLIGPAVMMGFNLVVHGSVVGGYIDIASRNGYVLADLGEKAVSLWLDSAALYGEETAALIITQPWLLLAMPGLFWALIRGDIVLRTIALSVVTLFVVYLPYADLLPNGLWRYLNIHYFKWTFPFFGLFAIVGMKKALQLYRDPRRGIPVAAGFIGWPVLLLFVGFNISFSRMGVSKGENNALLFSSLQQIDNIDFIDISGISGGFTDVYLGQHQLRVDGEVVQKISEYRLLPTRDGVRILFIRPAKAKLVEFAPDPKLGIANTASLRAAAGTYSIGIKRPTESPPSLKPLKLGSLALNDSVDLRFDGWSASEKTHRWTEGNRASLQFAQEGGASAPRKLTLKGWTLGAQRLSLWLIDVEIWSGRLSGKPEVLVVDVPPHALRNETNTLEFELPDARRPESGDPRILGFALESLSLE